MTPFEMRSGEGVPELFRRGPGAEQQHRLALRGVEAQYVAGHRFAPCVLPDDRRLRLRPRILEPARAAQLRADFDELDLPVSHRRRHDEPAVRQELERAVPTPWPGAAENFDQLPALIIGGAVQQRAVNARRQAADVLGIDGAGALAESHAVSEDLRAANTGDVDKAPRRVEAEEPTLQLRLGLVRRNRARSTIHERPERSISPAPRAAAAC